MGFRFRKAINIIPGVKLNLSKSGGSLSVGGKGFTVNLGRKGERTTTSLPGTGLSYSNYEKRGSNKVIGWVWTIVLCGGAYLFYTLRH